MSIDYSSPLFFMSYAREDTAEHVTLFFDALCERLSAYFPEANKLGFLDTHDIGLGQAWPAAVAEALSTAPLLIPLYSPRFFTRLECGREVTVFLDRIQQYGATSAPSRSILPVWWIRQRCRVHPCLESIRHDLPGAATAYARVGLEPMMNNRQTRRNVVQTFAQAFAEQIISVLDWPVLPPLKRVLTAEAYINIPSAFHRTSNLTASPRSSANAIHCACIAPTASEAATVRQTTSMYGTEPWEWKAFDPPETRPIMTIAQEVAAGEGLLCSPLEFDDRLPAQIEEARQNRRVVVVIVDSWVLNIPKYERLFSDFERILAPNCTVLVPFNESDNESSRARDHLRRNLKAVFYSRSQHIAASPYFQPQIRSRDQFAMELRKAIAALRAALLNDSRLPSLRSAVSLPTL